MIVQVLLILAVIFLVALYLTGEYNERYWKKRSVVFYPRSKIMGVSWDYLTKDRAFFEHFHDIYKKYPNEPAIGLGSLFKPALFVTDPINIQHVTASDFNSFNHRGFEIHDEDLLSQNILFLNGQKWKLARQSMSPLFTSAKLKSMNYIIDKSAQDIVPYIKDNPKLMKGDVFNTLSTFCSAAMTAAVFGITAESIFDSPFLKMAQEAFKSDFWTNLKFVMCINSELLVKVFKIKLFGAHEGFFIGAIKELLSQRKKDNIKRHDFADLCLSLQGNGILKDAETGFELQPTDELLAAQAFFFFTAGVEPTATTMFNALILLGQHPDILHRLQEEIDNAFEQNQGNISYDVISAMEYLDMVMNESMRMYPAIGYIVRQCVKSSTLPVGNIKVEKGTTIFIPVFPLHHDDKYYPNAHVFDPERFSRANKTSEMNKNLMAFGKGNRICIGMRYATQQAKAGIVQLLRNFSVKTIQTSKDGMKFRKEQIAVRLDNVDIEFIERKVKSF